jgi:hypothetical protein
LGSFVRVFSVPSSFLVCSLLGRYSVEDLPRSLGRVQKESGVRVQSSLVGNMSRKSLDMRKSGFLFQKLKVFANGRNGRPMESSMDRPESRSRIL